MICSSFQSPGATDTCRSTVRPSVNPRDQQHVGRRVAVQPEHEETVARDIDRLTLIGQALRVTGRARGQQRALHGNAFEPETGAHRLGRRSGRHRDRRGPRRGRRPNGLGRRFGGRAALADAGRKHSAGKHGQSNPSPHRGESAPTEISAVA